MNLNDKHLCYLTSEAAEALTKMERDFGFDRDLAIGVLEGFYGEAIYDLGTEEDEA